MKKILLSVLLSSCAFGDVKPKVPVAPVVPVVPAPQYKYAPHPKPYIGPKDLLCAGIDYVDGKTDVSAAKAQAMCNQVAEFYRRNSRGMLEIKTKGVHVDVPFEEKPANFNKVKALVKAKFPGRDWYAIVVGTRLGASHAGQGTAFLRGTLYRDAQHEVGHLIGFGHAGRYVMEKGKLTLQAYGDGQSVMSRFASDTLTAPQYYRKGWLKETEAAMYVPGTVYEVKRITDTKSEGLSTVIMLNSQFKDGGAVAREPAPKDEDVLDDLTDNVRDAYISYPTKCDGCLALHLSNGIGSQKVGTFGNEFYDERFTGMHVKIISKDKQKVKFTIDFESKLKSQVKS